MGQLLLTDYLHNAAVTWKDKEAIQDENKVITYGQLEEKSVTLAENINAMHPVKREPIGIYLPKGIDCITAMMGILLSGNIYCPLDVEAPFSYLDKMLDILQNGLVVTDAKGEKALSQKSGLTIIRIDFQGSLAAKNVQPQKNVTARELTKGIIDTDTALILFTSGSTGTPKGVAISHGRIIDYIEWAREYFSCDENTIIASQAPFVFTVSSMDIYMCLRAGAKLCIVPKHTLAQANLLTKYLVDNKISFIFWVPTAYQNISDEKAFDDIVPLDLKRCLFVGEPMAISTIKYWKDKLPQAEFYNLFGATETDMTLCCNIKEKHLQDKLLPLGHARKNVWAEILNEDGTEVQNGQTGEICILGRCLANGYWQDPEKTAKVFEVLAKDGRRIYHTGDLGRKDIGGEIYFLGRKDHQFKHMGYRIEANGIEATAMNSGVVKEACVIYDKEKQEIVMFLIATQPDFKRQLLRYMMSSLPLYMVPTRIVEMENIPRTASGKKDRISLGKTLIEKGI